LQTSIEVSTRPPGGLGSPLVRATLFGVPGSHPTLAGELMLERKGIEVRRFDLVAGVHRVMLRGLGFSSQTVPAVRLDGQRLQGTRTIALALDAMVPAPPLVPEEPERREAVLRAEAWADEVLQAAARRLTWAPLRRDRSTLGSYLEDAKLGIPVPLATAMSPPVIRLSARLNHADDEHLRRDLSALPAQLDRVDGLLAQGIIGGDEPNVADYQVATSVRLMMTLEDLRGWIERRPAGAHAQAVVPHFPGRIAPVFPHDWLPPAAR
jgi:glutathione S-transferase